MDPHGRRVALRRRAARPARRGLARRRPGPAGSHLAGILTATAAVLLVAAVTVLGVTAVSDHRGEAPLAAGGGGLLAATACVLTGAAIGTLTSRPLIASRGRSLAALLLGALALVTTGSPAHAAVASLVTGDRTSTVPLPWPALAGAVVLAAASAAFASRATARRG
ncbi:hypothetical protein [Streptomyces roseoviridis]|uniref:ABC transporter n=1 Tax=Streptomyces roseoviridis TaxID=67361 RepID=A0ABV5QWP4_9ACTN